MFRDHARPHWGWSAAAVIVVNRHTESSASLDMRPIVRGENAKARKREGDAKEELILKFKSEI
jgi:hypothetical protein